jgi:hypothetical protein
MIAVELILEMACDGRTSTALAQTHLYLASSLEVGYDNKY